MKFSFTPLNYLRHKKTALQRNFDRTLTTLRRKCRAAGVISPIQVGSFEGDSIPILGTI